MRNVDCACAAAHAAMTNKALSASFTIFMGSPPRHLARASSCPRRSVIVYTNTAASRYVRLPREGGNEPLERGWWGIVNVQARLVRQLGPAVAGSRVPGGIGDKLRLDRTAHVNGVRTARVKMAAG